MSTIKEALAHVTECETAHCCGSPVIDITLVRKALEAAQRESEPWKAIRTWCLEGFTNERGVSVWPSQHSDGWLIYCVECGYRIRGTDFTAPTRLEALEAAAKWCRAQVTK